ncbi:hypothetical protein BDZ91DRAFT_747951 [Kalaharituber pfeilii]|nr:hypothetical protein BDZ91DRAFT_747951 [Kalaharituber pfeilii]
MENKGNDRKYMDGHGNDWKNIREQARRYLFYGFPFRQVLGFPPGSGDPGS